MDMSGTELGTKNDYAKLLLALASTMILDTL
jgi:hypothetical protein